jgi:CCR4-NOT transcriptional regulation complex NOT5 subunit
MNLKEIEWKAVFYIMWHRRGTYIEFLWTRSWRFRAHKGRKISWVASPESGLHRVSE